MAKPCTLYIRVISCTYYGKKGGPALEWGRRLSYLSAKVLYGPAEPLLVVHRNGHSIEKPKQKTANKKKCHQISPKG